MKVVIDIPDEWKTRIENNRRPNTIECMKLITSIWKGKILTKGIWTPIPIGGYVVLNQCSNCSRHSVMKSKYCPNCGEEMEVEE